MLAHHLRPAPPTLNDTYSPRTSPSALTAPWDTLVRGGQRAVTGPAFWVVTGPHVSTIPQARSKASVCRNKKIHGSGDKAVDSCGSNLWTLNTGSGFMVSKLHSLREVTASLELFSRQGRGDSEIPRRDLVRIKHSYQVCTEILCRVLATE